MPDLSKYDAELAFFRQSVRKLPEITPESIRHLVVNGPFELDGKLAEAISRHLETLFDLYPTQRTALEELAYPLAVDGVRLAMRVRVVTDAVAWDTSFVRLRSSADDIDPIHWEVVRRSKVLASRRGAAHKPILT